MKGNDVLYFLTLALFVIGVIAVDTNIILSAIFGMLTVIYLDHRS